jgi:hypothetical protein
MAADARHKRRVTRIAANKRKFYGVRYTIDHGILRYFLDADESTIVHA